MGTFVLAMSSEASFAVFAGIAFAFGSAFWFMISRLLKKQGHNFLSIVAMIGSSIKGILAFFLLCFFVILLPFGDEGIGLADFDVSDFDVSDFSLPTAVENVPDKTIDEELANLERERRAAETKTFNELQQSMSALREKARQTRLREEAERRSLQQSARQAQSSFQKSFEDAQALHGIPYNSRPSSSRPLAGRNRRPQQNQNQAIGMGLPFTSDNNQPSFDPADIGTPETMFPPLKIEMARAKKTDLVGYMGEVNFKDQAENKSILVGLIVGQTGNPLTPIQSIQPVYQTVGQYLIGKEHGFKSKNKRLLLAPDGYAVGALQLNGSSVVTGVRLIFVECNRGILKTENVRESEWIGISDSDPAILNASGKHIVGLHGSISGGRISGLGLLTYSAKRDVALMRKMQETGNFNPLPNNQPVSKHELRTWNSSDYKFSIEAKLLNKLGDQIELEKSDGSTLKIELNKLCPEDQDYVAATDD